MRSGRRRRGESDLCDFRACAVAVLESVAEGDVEWVQCDMFGDEDGNGWYHKDCVGMRVVDLSSKQYECPVCKGEVENVEDVILKQELKKEMEKNKAELTSF